METHTEEDIKHMGMMHKSLRPVCDAVNNWYGNHNHKTLAQHISRMAHDAVA